MITKDDVTQTTHVFGFSFAEQHTLVGVGKNCFQPKAALAHLPLANLRSAHYRSKILPITQSINPLLSSAAAPLALAGQLHEGVIVGDDYELYAMLIHEIKAFEISAQHNGYRGEHVLVARYLLCATLDEVVLKRSANYQLLQHFHGEAFGGDRFFIILERLSLDPILHQDILELIYVCLSLGFVGKFQQQERGRIELDHITERLYETIRSQRGDSKKTLHIQGQAAKFIEPAVASQPLPFWLVPCFAALLFIILYLGFSFMLESSVAPLYQEFNTIVQTYADN